MTVSSWELVSRRANRNFCAIISDVTGRKLFFKHNLGGNFRYIVTDAELRRRDIANVLASRILSETFALQSMVYHDALLTFSDGHQLRGVACDYLESRRQLRTVPREHIKNRKEALWQIVVLTWLGDIDRTHSYNDLITSCGLYFAIDFDFCFSDGVSILGLPIANRLALNYFLSADVDLMIDTILSFNNTDIANMIGRLGHEWVNDWSDQYNDVFSDVLIRNRGRLSRSQALFKFSHKVTRRVKLLDCLVILFYEKIILMRKLRNILTNQGATATVLELRRQVDIIGLMSK